MHCAVVKGFYKDIREGKIVKVTKKSEIVDFLVIFALFLRHCTSFVVF